MIDIENVSYQYSSAEKENLVDFTLHVEKGECVVLTGESGCGKTCVTRLVNALIPHFYEGELKGSIRIDGINTTDIQPHDHQIRLDQFFKTPGASFLAWTQTVKLFSGWKTRGFPTDR